MLAASMTERQYTDFGSVLDHESDACVEAMNGLLQSGKRASQGFRTSFAFIAINCMRMGKLSHFPTNLLVIFAVP